ncbi:hypothetical protein OSB04_014485 [Centaurea solstitialis]|uniref:Reverse transcriptase Ty1/copia-type domain-containing protein n=1 Tax=Centaurea solstitialis TaxID=347529 RepID=A0AA38SX63_9ASTR|nr:hypothetical protein OSB04_014485 [Centaurea solstitialis]
MVQKAQSDDKKAWLQTRSVRSHLIKRQAWIQTRKAFIIILIVYVDDKLVTRVLAQEFEVKDLRPMKFFLGMEVARTKEGIAI